MDFDYRSNRRLVRITNLKGGSLGLIGNIVVGIVGGFIGYWLLGGRLGDGVVGEILTGTIGAIVLLAVVNLFTRGKV